MEKTLSVNKIVVANYQANTNLSDKQQTAIVRIIVNHFPFKEMKMDAKMMENVATAITKLPMNEFIFFA